MWTGSCDWKSELLGPSDGFGCPIYAECIQRSADCWAWHINGFPATKYGVYGIADSREKAEHAATVALIESNNMKSQFINCYAVVERARFITAVRSGQVLLLGSAWGCIHGIPQKDGTLLWWRCDGTEVHSPQGNWSREPPRTLNWKCYEWTVGNEPVFANDMERDAFQL